MAIPVLQEELEMVLRPWLGSLFLTSNPMLDQLTQTAVTCEKMPLLCQASASIWLRTRV